MNTPVNIKGSISISRTSDGLIRFQIKDRDAGVKFIEFRMTGEDFGQCITGLSEVEIDAEIKGLDIIGKKKIFERRSIEYPFPVDYVNGGKKYRQWLEENAQEEGWIVDTSLNKQGAIYSDKDKVILNYVVFKYV